jgi:hypothetical protein
VQTLKSLLLVNLPPTFSMVTLMLLPVGHGGALAKATSGLGVDETTNFPPVLRGDRTKTEDVAADSPLSKSFATTWT